MHTDPKKKANGTYQLANAQFELVNEVFDLGLAVKFVIRLLDFDFEDL